MGFFNPSKQIDIYLKIGLNHFLVLPNLLLTITVTSDVIDGVSGVICHVPGQVFFFFGGGDAYLCGISY